MFKTIACLAAALLASYGCGASQDVNVMPLSSRFGEFNMYFLFDRDNSRTSQRIYATAASINALRTIRQKTVVIIHGHEGSATTSLNPTLKDAFLTSEDVSVIVVDWSVVARGSYEYASGAVSDVGAAVADLLRLMIARNQVNLGRLHLVGHGLGAHVCAFVARALTTGTVARITGLDPAGPGYESGAVGLRQSDATYVEVIHTDGVDGTDPSLGIGRPTGHVDFFPNGGTAQPGCDDAHECNHNRAWELFAASLTHQNLEGKQCSGTEFTEDECKGFSLRLGNNEFIKYGSGSFFLETSDTYPYGLNDNCVKLCGD